MKAWALIAAGAALAGCFDKPPFAGGRDAGDDGGPDAGPLDPACTSGGAISTGVDGQGRRVVCGPGYSLRFSDRGYGFPDSFVVGGSELLAHGDTCEDEDGVGVGLYPAGRVAGVDPAGTQQIDGGRRVELELDTPFLKKVAITWSTAFTGCTLGAHGRSTFTFFADGRIVRQDHVIDDSQASAATCQGACAEATGAGWYVTSFTTLVRTAELTHVVPPGEDDRGPGVPTGHDVCVADDGFALAMNFYGEVSRLRVPAAGVRAFVQDVVLEQPATLPSIDRHVRTSYLVAVPRAACSPLEAALAAHSAMDPQLVVEGSPRGAGWDGIYGGENDTGDTGIGVANADVELTRGGAVDLPGGWAVWIDYGAVFTTFDVQKTGGDTTGAWYQLAAAAGGPGKILLWFRDPLRAGETITIHPH